MRKTLVNGTRAGDGFDSLCDVRLRHGFTGKMCEGANQRAAQIRNSVISIT